MEASLTHAAEANANAVGARAGQPFAADKPLLVCRRARLDAITVEVNRPGRQRSYTLTVREEAVAFIAPLRGHVVWIGSQTSGKMRALRANDMAVLGRPGASTLVWSGDAEGVTVITSRNRLQALINLRHVDPVRVAAADTVIALDPTLHAMMAELGAWVWQAASHVATDQHHWRDEVEKHLAAALIASPQWSQFAVSPRAIQHAVTTIRANAEIDLDQQGLAEAAGVTLRTLREGFTACYGMSLTQFIRTVRLSRAHERLASGYDSRPMHQVALAAGFSSPSTFNRAFQRAFGERPASTRARGVRDGP